MLVMYGDWPRSIIISFKMICSAWCIASVVLASCNLALHTATQLFVLVDLDLQAAAQCQQLLARYQQVEMLGVRGGFEAGKLHTHVVTMMPTDSHPSTLTRAHTNPSEP
jgi:hypothetical protein